MQRKEGNECDKFQEGEPKMYVLNDFHVLHCHAMQSNARES